MLAQAWREILRLRMSRVREERSRACEARDQDTEPATCKVKSGSKFCTRARVVLRQNREALPSRREQLCWGSELYWELRVWNA